MSIGIDQIHRYTVDEYHRLGESGGLDPDARVELIEGLLVDMTIKSREHENAIAWLTRWLVLAVDPARVEVRVHSSLTLERSEPEPDLLVVPLSAARPYHPATAALVIEVSVSSLRHDLLVKRPLYARADVGEYWVVDIDGRRVVRHREPSAGDYRAVDELRERDRLVASALELPPLDLSELFAAAFS